MHAQLLQRIVRAPPGVGDHGHGVIANPHRAAHAAQCLDAAVVKALQLAAEHGAGLDRRAQHAVELDVGAEDLGAIELVGGVQALERLAGNLPLLGVFQRDALGRRWRQLGRSRRQLAIADLATAGPVADHAPLHRQLAHRHRPLLGRRLQQHQPCGGATTAHIVLRGAYAPAAAGAHFAPGAGAGMALAGRDHLGAEARPVALQFLGHQLRQAGARALAHFGTGNADHTAVVRLDHDPDIDLAVASGYVLRLQTPRRQAQTQGQPAGGDRGRTDDEMAACCHAHLLQALAGCLAARCTPSRTRW